MYRRFITTLVLSIIFGVVCCTSVYAVGTGDGNLLRRTNQGDDTCGGPTNACHNLQVHNATNTESSYWSSNPNKWGDTATSKYGKFVCQTCHTPHNTNNIYLIREKIKFPDGSTMPSLLTESTVDFRYKSGTAGSAPYVMGDDSDNHTTSTRPCEVCHSLTKHHRYNTSAQTDGKTHNNAIDCNNCHYHEQGFKKLGEGGAECGTCHSTITTPMLGNDSDGQSKYHMVMQNVDITNIGGIGTDSKYPSESTPAASSTHRRCLMCHAEMENFSPLKNASTPGRAYNLRKTITTAPSNQSDTSQLANTDYDKGTSSGICTSCHQYQQTKDNTKQTTADNTTYTPVINPALFANSPHNYTVDVTNAFIDNSTFKANCVKCHNDTLTKEKQTGAYNFGLHVSTVRRLNAVTNANETSSSPNYNKTNYGTATSGTTTTIVDTNKNWTTNMWANRPVNILSGTGNGQTRWIASNTSNTLTITTLTTAPSTDSVYLIGDSRSVDSGTSTGSNTATTLNDTTKTTSWKSNYWKNRLITIVYGTGTGQTRKISTNTGTALTVSQNWTTTPDLTSKYSIGDPMEEDFCFKCHSMTNPNAKTATKMDYYGAATVVNGKMLKMEDMFMTYTGTGGTGSNADTTNCPSATYPTSTSIVISPSPAWTTGQWASYAIRITGGTGAGQIRKIAGSGASFLCLDKDWTTAPVAASAYKIGQIRHRIDAYAGVHRTDEVINAPSTSTSAPAGWFTTTGTNPTYHSGCTDCHNPHAQKKSGDDNGTATGGTATTITDTNKSTWTQDQWRGYNLRLMDGTGAGQERMIVTNTTTGTIYVGAAFSISPDSGTYYTIVPTGRPDKGNNLAGPNNGQWGVDVAPADYPTPAVGSYSNPVFTKNTSLVSGSDKIYELCFKCHSDYGWGNNGTPFNIVDATSATINVYQTTASTNIAREFNPHNVGYHPVVDVGANQPITAMGGSPVNVGSSSGYTISSGTTADVTVGANLGTANQYDGNCVEIVGTGTGNGQIRSISSHTAVATSVITVDPAFNTAPAAAGNTAYIRKCSIYNNGSDYDPLTAPYPKITRGTITLTAGSSTATINLGASSNGIPSTVIPGWYLYVGTLYSAVNNNVMPNVGACSATAPCPPMLATSGWYQVTGISVNASGTGTTSVTLNITPPPPTNSSGNNYALTAGLGNNFIPPYGPWSVIACTDCHDTDSPTDPSGPHGSARPWILRQLEAQSFPWFIGGINATTATNPTTPNSATYLITVGYPDGSTAWPNVGTANGNPMPNYMCLNCHRADVYGYEDTAPKDDTAPTGASFSNFAWRYMSRLPHIPDGSSGHPKDSDGSANATNSYGIMCLNCHAKFEKL